LTPKRRIRAARWARCDTIRTSAATIREALEKITDEKHANNVSLASIIRGAKVPLFDRLPQGAGHSHTPLQRWSVDAPAVAIVAAILSAELTSSLEAR
jgi:hypothetical protein